MAHRLSNEELAAEASSFDVDPYVIAHEAETEHFRDLYSAAPAALKHELGLSVEQHGQSLLFAAKGIEHLLFTRAHLGGSGELVRGELDAILESVAAKEIKEFLIHVDARIPLAEEAFEQRGMVSYRRPWVKLLRGEGPVAPVSCELDVAEVTQEHADTCSTMMMNVFGLPREGVPLYVHTVGREGWHWYLATDNGEPAATGVLFQRGPVAYLAGGVTLPKFRRRRAQGALMQRRIVDALAWGAKHIVSETGFPFPDEENPSYRNMMHFGFRAVGTRHNFGPPGVKW